MSHYFDEAPQVASRRRTVDVALPDVTFRYDTDRGVFGHGHLDPGTRLLLQEAGPPPPAGELLDLGCGAGPIAIATALRSPAARVWAVDVNERARALCATNARALRLTNITVAAPDGVPGDVCFDAIWSNPPIRIGKQPLHDLLRHWLDRLAADGVAWLVVHRHLGADSLHRWLDDSGWPTTRAQTRGGYRLLRCTSSRRTSRS